MTNYETLSGVKYRISRNRTKIIDCNNVMVTQNIKRDNTGATGKYSEYNYQKRLKKRADKIKELCYNSFAVGACKFITLTFDPKLFPKDFTADMANTHAEFKLFIKRVNDHYDDFKYIATFSRQRNRSVHYHMIANFDTETTSKSISDIWKNGSINSDIIFTKDDFKRIVNYLVKNMNESAEELHGAKGYLYSKNLDRDIIVTSWKPEQTAEFDEISDKIMSEKAYSTHSTAKLIGIERTVTDEVSGEVYEQFMPQMELTEEMKTKGFKERQTTFDYYNSTYSFADKFKPLVTAKPKAKKFKHKSLKSRGDTG